jgi:hypothetical protein
MIALVTGAGGKTKFPRILTPFDPGNPKFFHLLIQCIINAECT